VTRVPDPGTDGTAPGPAGRDFVHLAGGNWSAWRGMVLRSAGFPVRRVEDLADPRLAAAADARLAAAGAGRRAARRAYEAEFTAAAGRSAAAIRSAAADPRLREAVTWQNRRFTATCLDRPEPADGRRTSAVRKREGAIAGYLQRYATKNESIGFFGPIGWAEWAPEAAAATVKSGPGPGMLSRRTVYFESWAIDAVCAALAERPELRAGLAPRRVPAHLVRDDEVVLAAGTTVRLPEPAAAVLRLCDGRRTVREIAAALAVDRQRVLSALNELSRRDLIRRDLDGPMESRPEDRLRERIASSPESAARTAALADLDRLLHARDEVAAAAGDDGRLAAALADLDAQFERITGRSAVRGEGRTYAARTIVFEDTVRDVEVIVGGDVLDALGAPLSLVMDSARWLAARIAEAYTARLGEHFERISTLSDEAEVPLARLLSAAARDFRAPHGAPEPTWDARAELVRRWERILNVPDGVRRHAVRDQDIADRVRTEFATEAPPWACGRLHSPDVMLAAASPEAVARGEYRLVLGEVHVACNTVESQALADQHPDPSRLAAMVFAAAGGGRRIVPVLPRGWGLLSRTATSPAVLAPAVRQVALGADPVAETGGEVIPVGALVVERDGAGLTVRNRADGSRTPLAEVAGQYVSTGAVDAFAMLRRRRHRPRVSIGRLVVARESWTLPPRLCDWARQLHERRRYLQMRAWVARYGLPRRAFYALSLETKPAYVDFTSLALTNRLAADIRRLAADGSDGDVTFTEMLPGPEDCWLAGPDGERYTSEFRMVVTESGVLTDPDTDPDTWTRP
jgi:hypothetical protein